MISIKENLLTIENWRENVLRLAIYSSLGGLFLLLLIFLLFPFDIDLIAIGVILGLITCIATLIFLRQNKLYVAVWCFIIGVRISEMAITIRGEDPNHLLVILASVIGIVIVSVTGTPVQTFVSGTISIISNISLTSLFTQGYLTPAPIVSWAESTITINI